MMNLIQSYLTNNRCYTNAERIKVSGLMLHSVGVPQPNASVFIRNWDNQSAAVCVHGFIEAGGDVYNTLPWEYRAWHCGGGGNATHIGVEMTEPSSISYTGNGANYIVLDEEATRFHVQATYAHAVQLFAMLSEMFSLDPLAPGVIISHSEGYRLGIASNHADVEHLWNRYGLTMDKFRADVRYVMDGGVVEPPPDPGEAQRERIRVIQEWLNGRYDTNLAVDGIYGAKTRQALIIGLQTEINLSSDAGLVVDGIWGPLTQAACPIVSMGSQGSVVYILQGALYCNAYIYSGFDGIFGQNTFAEVQSFQRGQGLIADGIAGPLTFAKLFA